MVEHTSPIYLAHITLLLWSCRNKQMLTQKNWTQRCSRFSTFFFYLMKSQNHRQEEKDWLWTAASICLRFSFLILSVPSYITTFGNHQITGANLLHADGVLFKSDGSDDSMVTVRQTVIFYAQDPKCSVCCIALCSIQDAATAEKMAYVLFLWSLQKKGCTKKISVTLHLQKVSHCIT